MWREADEIEVFESAWNWDHFYPLAEPYDGPNLEGWTMLAALAQATSRLRLGAMVNGMHHRHPAVTANMAATLDLISGGRFELGMGAGWNEMESDAYGIPLGSLQERSDRFEEGIEIIRVAARRTRSPTSPASASQLDRRLVRTQAGAGQAPDRDRRQGPHGARCAPRRGSPTSGT